MDNPKWLYDRELLVRGYNHINEAAELVRIALTLCDSYVPAQSFTGRKFTMRAKRMLAKLDKRGK